jgi:hypothetical protein
MQQNCHKQQQSGEKESAVQCFLSFFLSSSHVAHTVSNPAAEFFGIAIWFFRVRESQQCSIAL